MALRITVLLLGLLISGCQVATPKTDSEVEQFTEEPIIEGSDVLLVGLGRAPGYRRPRYTLSTGRSIDEKQLVLLREVASRFDKNKVEIAELLLHLTILKDDMEQTYFIGACQPGFESGMQLYVLLGKETPSLRFRVDYFDSNWIGIVQSFKIAADDYRWQSPPCTFRGNHLNQYYDIPATVNETELAKTIAHVHKVVVRFQASEGYRDKEVGVIFTLGNEEILRLYELMGGKPQNG